MKSSSRIYSHWEPSQDQLDLINSLTINGVFQVSVVKATELFQTHAIRGWLSRNNIRFRTKGESMLGNKHALNGPGNRHGRPCPEHVKEYFSDLYKGRKATWLKGKPLSVEHRAQISQNLKGNKYRAGKCSWEHLKLVLKDPAAYAAKSCFAYIVCLSEEKAEAYGCQYKFGISKFGAEKRWRQCVVLWESNSIDRLTGRLWEEEVKKIVTVVHKAEGISREDAYILRDLAKDILDKAFSDSNSLLEKSA